MTTQACPLPLNNFKDQLRSTVTGKSGETSIRYKLWIGMQDYLLRQLEYHIPSLNEVNRRIKELHKQSGGTFPELPDFDSEDQSVFFQEVHQNIRINLPLTDEVFKFTPPPGAKFVDQGSLLDLRSDFWETIKNVGAKWFWLFLMILILFLSIVCWAVFSVRRVGLSTSRKASDN
jgi:hypothetical protein